MPLTSWSPRQGEVLPRRTPSPTSLDLASDRAAAPYRPWAGARSRPGPVSHKLTICARRSDRARTHFRRNVFVNRHPQSSTPSVGQLQVLVVPTITSVSPAAGPPSGNNSVTLTGTGFVNVLTVRFGTAATTFTVDSTTQITAIVPPGTGTVQVTVVTTGGTSNGVSYTYVGVPTLTGVSPSQGPTSGGTSVTLTGTSLTGATAVNFGATAATSFTVNSATQITAVAPAGTGSVQVKVVGPGGTSNGVFYTYVAVPVLISVSPNQGPASGNNSVTLTGTGFTGATAVRFGTVSTSFTADSATQITAIAPAGTLAVQVTVTTVGGTSNGVSYTYVAVPVLTSVSPTSGPAVGGNTVTLTGTGLIGTTTVTFGATGASSFTVVSDTHVTAVAPGGTGSVQVTMTTAGGVSNSVPYSYIAVPVLTSLSPTAGPVAGGTTVTLTGVGLAATTAVSFGSAAATSFTVASDTHVTAVAPGGSGSVQVTVTTAGGTSNGVPYTYVAVPSSSGVSPDRGPTAGGTSVMLTGTNLTGATAVSFGTTAATSFTVDSGTQITAVAPAGTCTVRITVTTAGGTSNGVPYIYVPVPALIVVGPISGPAVGGNTVTLAGADLTGVTAVTFGAIVTTSFTVVSDTQIAVVAPAGAGQRPVTATSSGGISNGLFYTFINAPTLGTPTPVVGPTSGGTSVTVPGTDLTTTQSVAFDGVAAPFAVISDTVVVAVTPPGTSGAVDVVVRTTGGSATAASAFAYVAGPDI
ncbi:IPT/TIG domain-containing protein [Nocardia sp. NPDC049190]|uniref:beta strand repeat-containing protein n=1 Tax=Nocardia sp. NPDC049190 TaxID=3155650 RepID=UPI0033FB9FB0